MARQKAKQKLPRWFKITLWVVLLTAIMLALYQNKKYIRRAYRYLTHKYYKTGFKPTDFPVSYDIHGIDVSHYQDVINWKKLMAVDTYGDTVKFRFVIIKATEGLLIEDDMFDENWDDAKDHGYTRGAYHYFLPDRSPKVQATNFITSVKLEKGDFPPIIDVEELRGKTKADLVKNLKEFIKEIEAHYKVKPILYSNINFIEDFLLEDFGEYKFWVAHYYRDEIVVDEKLQWVFWQHSDKADLLGITGATDANVFNGDEYKFQKLLMK